MDLIWSKPTAAQKQGLESGRTEYVGRTELKVSKV